MIDRQPVSRDLPKPGLLPDEWVTTCGDNPPDRLTDPFFESPVLAVSDEGCLLNLPCGSRLFLATDGGLQAELPSDRELSDLRPFLQGTFFAVAAWSRGLVPFELVALRIGTETFLFGGNHPAGSDALAAMVARETGADCGDGMLALDPAQSDRCHLPGAPLSILAEAARAWLPGLAGAATCPGSQRVTLTLPVAPAGVHAGQITLIHLDRGETPDPVFTPLDQLHTTQLLRRHVALPGIGVHHLGKEGLDEALAALAGGMSTINIGILKEMSDPSPVAAILCAGLPRKGAS
jgi:hypothetical protein